jgi:addiction module HigA family antidote
MSEPNFVNASPKVERAEELYRPHPGEVFSRRFVTMSDLKQPQIAEVIGISTKHLSRFINGHVSVGIDLARKLEACTNISAQAWLHYQTQFDLHTTSKLEKSSVRLSA